MSRALAVSDLLTRYGEREVLTEIARIFKFRSEKLNDDPAWAKRWKRLSIALRAVIKMEDTNERRD